MSFFLQKVKVKKWKYKQIKSWIADSHSWGSSTIWPWWGILYFDIFSKERELEWEFMHISVRQQHIYNISWRANYMASNQDFNSDVFLECKFVHISVGQLQLKENSCSRMAIHMAIHGNGAKVEKMLFCSKYTKCYNMVRMMWQLKRCCFDAKIAAVR